MYALYGGGGGGGGNMSAVVNGALYLGHPVAAPPQEGGSAPPPVPSRLHKPSTFAKPVLPLFVMETRGIIPDGT